MGTFYTQYPFHTTEKVIEMKKDENGEKQIEWVKDEKGKQVKHRTLNTPMMGVIGALAGGVLEIAGGAGIGYGIEHYVANQENRVNDFYEMATKQNDTKYNTAFETINKFICPETAKSIEKEYTANKTVIDAELWAKAEEDAKNSRFGALAGGLACIVGLGVGGVRLTTGCADDKSRNPLDILSIGMIVAGDLAESATIKLNKINRESLAKKYPDATLMTEQIKHY